MMPHTFSIGDNLDCYHIYARYPVLAIKYSIVCAGYQYAIIKAIMLLLSRKPVMAVITVVAVTPQHYGIKYAK